MLNKQYTMSISDVAKFKKLKVSSLYKSYIQNIVNSPILINVANEHVKNIDITDDIEHILSKDSYTPKQLNKLFKETIKTTAINMVADTLIVKDIIDVSFADAAEDLEDNFKVQYLLGRADESYYLKAAELLKTDPDTNSLIYRGYQEYIKYKEKDLIFHSDISVLTAGIATTVEEKKTDTSKKSNKKKSVVDIDANDIIF